MRVFLLLSVLFILGCQIKEISNYKKIKRVALVIGNRDYGNNSLKNSINDAIGIKSVLEKIGFDVILKKDVTLLEFYKALDELKAKIEPNNTIVFFYFAGHGNTLSQKSSQEYLMMTDKNKRVVVGIYKLYEFLDRAKARYNIVVIDACRDYQKSYISANNIDNQRYIKNLKNFRGNIREAKGKIKKELIIHDDNCPYIFPRSTIISYATMHNQIAKDWSRYDKTHSPYTRQLIKYLDDEEIPIEEVFRRVRTSMIRETNRTQINLEENSLEQNVWLVPKKGQISFAPPI